jgi:hypothetical protein
VQHVKPENDSPRGAGCVSAVLTIESLDPFQAEPASVLSESWTPPFMNSVPNLLTRGAAIAHQTYPDPRFYETDGMPSQGPVSEEVACNGSARR